MGTPIISLEVLPCIFLVKLENGETMEVVSLVDYTLIQHANIMRPITMIELLRPRITPGYPFEESFQDLEPLETKQGELLEMEQEEEQNPKGSEQPLEETSTRKRKREDYDANDEDSEACLHYHIKRRRTFIIESSSEEESNTTKDAVAKNEDTRLAKEEDKKESIGEQSIA